MATSLLFNGEEPIGRIGPLVDQCVARAGQFVANNERWQDYVGAKRLNREHGTVPFAA